MLYVCYVQLACFPQVFREMIELTLGGVGGLIY